MLASSSRSRALGDRTERYLLMFSACATDDLGDSPTIDDFDGGKADAADGPRFFPRVIDDQPFAATNSFVSASASPSPRSMLRSSARCDR